MTTFPRVRQPLANNCHSETGRLSNIVMCLSAYFQIVKPANVVQWMYSSDSLPRLQPQVIAQQHKWLVDV